ncbi:MAG: response regulator [Chloroflexi bacterium]|nr:response regulator [Chloroflexota bacterium]
MDAKILLVDDEPMVTDVMERYLRREGFQVLLAADGEAAVATAQESAPDLILLDLMLPKIDGLTAFRQIRSHSSVPPHAINYL